MRLLWLLVFLAPIAIASAQSKSGSTSKEQAAAADEVKALLNDPAAREKVIQDSPRARKADKAAKVLSHGDEKIHGEIYEAASKAFESVMVREKGDPKAMEKAVENAQQDPQSFYESLSPEARAAIRKIAAELDPNGKSPDAPK